MVINVGAFIAPIAAASLSESGFQTQFMPLIRSIVAQYAPQKYLTTSFAVVSLTVAISNGGVEATAPWEESSVIWIITVSLILAAAIGLMAKNLEKWDIKYSR